MRTPTPPAIKVLTELYNIKENVDVKPKPPTNKLNLTFLLTQAASQIIYCRLYRTITNQTKRVDFSKIFRNPKQMRPPTPPVVGVLTK